MYRQSMKNRFNTGLQLKAQNNNLTVSKERKEEEKMKSNE